MNCLDSSGIIDDWRGEEFTRIFVQSFEDDDPVGTPAIGMFELDTGALLSDAPDEDIPTVAGDLDWADVLRFTDGAAREAADIRGDLTQRGEQINPVAVLVAGTARNIGATLVTTDSDFEQIDDLSVEHPAVYVDAPTSIQSGFGRESMTRANLRCWATNV